MTFLVLPHIIFLNKITLASFSLIIFWNRNTFSKEYTNINWMPHWILIIFKTLKAWRLTNYVISITPKKIYDRDDFSLPIVLYRCFILSLAVGHSLPNPCLRGQTLRMSFLFSTGDWKILKPFYTEMMLVNFFFLFTIHMNYIFLIFNLRPYAKFHFILTSTPS